MSGDRWEPSWHEGRTAVPLTRAEASALYALIGEWIETKDGKDRRPIDSLAGHSSRDVESIILKMGAVIRSMKSAPH